MGLWQGVLAGVAAVGLHVAGFAMVPMPSGSQAAGNGGDALITLAASDASVAAMVANWDAVPSVGDAAPLAMVTVDAPMLATPALDNAPRVPARLALPQPVFAEQPPQIGTAPPPFAPALRPKARPAPQPEAAPAPTAQRARSGAGTAGQVAAGAGGGTEAGDSGQGQAGTSAAMADLRAGWGAGIRAKIERKKRYPAGTTATGTVKLRLTVGTDGRLQGVSVVASSGDAALDAAAVRAVNAAGRFAKAPRGVSGAAGFTLNMSFSR